MVVGWRVRDPERDDVVAGSRPVACAECGRPTWLGPTSLAHLAANPEARPTCVPCAALAVAAEEREVEVGVLPGVWAEFYGHRNRH